MSAVLGFPLKGTTSAPAESRKYLSLTGFSRRQSFSCPRMITYSDRAITAQWPNSNCQWPSREPIVAWFYGNSAPGPVWTLTAVGPNAYFGAGPKTAPSVKTAVRIRAGRRLLKSGCSPASPSLEVFSQMSSPSYSRRQLLPDERVRRPRVVVDRPGMCGCSPLSARRGRQVEVAGVRWDHGLRERNLLR